MCNTNRRLSNWPRAPGNFINTYPRKDQFYLNIDRFAVFPNDAAKLFLTSPNKWTFGFQKKVVTTPKLNLGTVGAARGLSFLFFSTKR